MNRWLIYGVLLPMTLAIVIPPTQAAPAETAWQRQAIAAPAPAETTILRSTQAVTGTPELTGTLRIATLIGDFFSRAAEEILGLHDQEIGFGNIVHALALTVQTDSTLEEILAMRAQDMGWGEIRRELGLHPGGGHSTNLGQIISGGRGRGRNPHGDDWVPPGQRNRQDRVPPGQVGRDE